MVRINLNPDLVSSIIHAIFEAQNRFLLDDQTDLFIVPRADADEIMKSIRDLAVDQKIIAETKEWSGRYLIQLYHQKFPAVPNAVGRTLLIMAQYMDETPIAAAGTEQTTIMARPGTIKPGTVVLINSRKCANPTCPVHFIPRIWNQKYCVVQCGAAHRKSKRSNHETENISR